jgi:polar amino acid transport system permease protein
MTYKFEFSAVFEAWPELLNGMLTTLSLSAAAMALGLLVAIVGALGQTAKAKPVRFLVGAYIEIIRNTPFPIQLFMIYFGLPTIGIRMSPNTTALIALVINFGAYGIEIVRAGIESISKGQIEAGTALGLKPLQIFRHIILKPAIKTIYPALTSQFILLMLYSSVCSTIAATELTGAAGDIQSRTFRSFEVYFVVTAIYFAMSLFFWAIFAFIDKRFVSTWQVARS